MYQWHGRTRVETANDKKDRPINKVGLILPGGGARNAYQVGALKAIAEMLPKDTPNPFAVICGTSAGAITASGYSSGRSICYFQGTAGLEPWQRTRRQGCKTELTLDHIMASIALPSGKRD